jgi:hypothetical protein
MKKINFFLIGMTSLVLAFAMIGCDQGTKVEYRDRVVGGSSNPGSSNSPEDNFVLAVRASTLDKPARVPNGLTLNKPLTVEKGQHIEVGAPAAPVLSVNSVGDGPLFDAGSAVNGDTFNIAAQLTVAMGGKLTVHSDSAVNVITPTLPPGEARKELLTVKGGGIVDVKGTDGLHIEPLAEAHFESGAILAVANAASVVVVETGGTTTTPTYGHLTIESGLKLVVPTASGETTKSVFAPADEGEAVNPIFVIPEESGAAEINTKDLAVYTNAEATPEAVAENKVQPSTEAATSVTEEAAKVSAPVFTRTKDFGTYIIESFSGSKAMLKKVTTTEGGEPTTAIGDASPYIVNDDVKTIINAVYAPNAPGTTDLNTDITPKSLLGYTDDVSAAVLDLFYITIGTDTTTDLIEIKGSLHQTVLDLTGTGVSPALPTLVIDLGLPNTDNTGLPTFKIPYQKFGKIPAGGGSVEPDDTSYGGVRLRVNKGAYLFAEADNGNYKANGAGTEGGCSSGYFNKGCVEVMAGGKLRDGAYQGYPLGDSATILNRRDSYLAIGPEPGSADAIYSEGSHNTDQAYNAYYAGWLIGKSDPGATDANYKLPRIEWDTGLSEKEYIEVRPGELVLSAKVTVKKTTGIIYSVWFVNSTGATPAELTINIPSAGATGGLFSNDHAKFRFYGQTGSKINVTSGSLHESFLVAKTDTSKGNSDVITSKVMINKGSDGGTQDQAEQFDEITGFLNWAEEPAADEPGE